MLMARDVKHKKRQDSCRVAPLKNTDGLLYSGNQTQVGNLNHQFHAVYTRENASNIPSKGKSTYQFMTHIKVSNKGVRKLLRDLNIHKAFGPDQIPSRLLRDFADELAPTLTSIFEKSLDTGEISDDWREASIGPLYKKGDRHNAANYRAISLISVSCEIQEHVIHSQIIDHYYR
jgi:hypothetical protein